jgi:hypothetical protein
VAALSKNDLDPFRVIVGVLVNRADSDLFVGVSTATGLRFDLRMSDEQAATHKTRIRALLPRILNAYDAMDDQARLTAARVALANFAPSYWETKDRAIAALSAAGWQLRGEDLVVSSPDVREMFFPKGSPWDAHVVLRDVLGEAKATLTVVDAYADGTLFQMLASRPLAGLTIRILCTKYATSVAAEARTFMAQHAGVAVKVREAKDFHDRFIIIDEEACVHVGASIKDAGKTAFMVSRVQDPDNLAAILATLGGSWRTAKQLL